VPTSSDDPYVYPGTTVLRNLLDITDPAELARAEYRYTWYRRTQLEDNPIDGSFDLPHLQEIHRRLFQDLFDWAGLLRTVTLSKGSTTFFASSDFTLAAAYTFEPLHEGPLLEAKPIDDDTFVVQAAELLSRINYLHPFREGNGRAQRAFLDQVAAHSGRTLSWRNVGAMDNTRASIEAYEAGSGKPFEPLLRRVIAPPLDGLSPFDADLYRVDGPLI
jgi:cell filamentation protein